MKKEVKHVKHRLKTKSTNKLQFDFKQSKFHLMSLHQTQFYKKLLIMNVHKVIAIDALLSENSFNRINEH